MILLVLFAFLAGIVTVLSPCILPILPLILSSSIGGKETGKARPLGVIVGFVASFTLFTLFLSSLVRLSGISADVLRLLSVIIIAGFGISLLVPQLQILLERLFSKLTAFAPKSTAKKGFGSGLLLGVSLGLLWTPCVGPILASVISLAITGSITFSAFLITLAYSLGTAIPMLAIMLGGRELLWRVPWLTANAGKIQKAFGLLMILTALAIATNADRKFQTYILNAFPEYGVGLTKFEDRNSIREELKKLGGEETEKENVGKSLFDILQPKGIKAPKIIPGGVWINSEPLLLEKLRGKVVIIDFWTYTCINCQRTFPYLRKWHETYKDKGLVIIGVHSPEFEFEKSEKNLRRAVSDFGLRYPIVQDNNFSTWKAYGNRYWPAKYFIDKEGNIRYSHFGEGDYDKSEWVIQELLKETGIQISENIGNPEYQTYARTPETYLGYARISNFASSEKIVADTSVKYNAPKKLPTNAVAFEGNWTVMNEYAQPEKGAKLYLNFEAKEVFLVMRATSNSAQMKVFVDDAMQDFGEDNKNGTVTVDSDRLYKLINLQSPGRHLLQLEFQDDNAEVYAFTFG